ncbi:ABC transporter ATP-binding protein [Streptomyces niveus]|uniref:ABC transporter ATP-binding protein n=1 Tax=Streptomyces niveus TaxID=193462 RepID=UPI0036B6EEBA
MSHSPSDQSKGAVLVAEGVRRSYGTGRRRVDVLKGVDVTVARGEFVAVMGPSGSGKSTLLNCLAGLDRPDGGTVRIGGTTLTGMNEAELTMFRRERLGFVFQDYGLIDGLTARQNIELPSRVGALAIDDDWLGHLVARTGIADLADRTPARLSGGQRQRVAITRALLSRPELVIADEPTGALDTHSSHQVLDLLSEIVAQDGQTVVMVTHDPVAAARAHTVLLLADGALAGSLSRPSAAQVAEWMSAAAQLPASVR